MKTETELSARYGKAIKALRLFHRLSQRELAKELDLPNSYVSEIENGKRPATLKMVEKYADRFGVTPSEILYLGENYGTEPTRENPAGQKVLKILDWIIDAQK